MGKLVFLNLGKKGLQRSLPLTWTTSGCGLTSVRPLTGKTQREPSNKPKPWPYWKKDINAWTAFWDKCTARFDENTKMVVVDGAHGVGKTKFAKELAEELDFFFIPEANMDKVYKSNYGKVDLRDFKDYFLPRTRPYDEKDFMRAPVTDVPGVTDRFLYLMYAIKYRSYIMGLRHIFNTGQGVVIEKSPYSHYAYIEAAYNQGWIDKSSRKFMNMIMYEYTLPCLLRPNLLIYLDAPVDVVQKKLKEQGHEWDKNSPVLSTSHLTDLYTLMKRDYLVKAKKNSQVLVYDWSEEGETEIVVEDIERLNLDYYGQYEEQQKDWRLYNEEYANMFRIRYSTDDMFVQMMADLTGHNQDLDPDNLFHSPEEFENLTEICSHIPGHRYTYGFNTDMGDKNILFRCNIRQSQHDDFWFLPMGFASRAPVGTSNVDNYLEMNPTK